MVNEIHCFQASISCSWAPNISTDVLTFGDKDDPNQWDTDGAIIHSISEENFISLKHSKEDIPCMIYIQTNDPLTQITNISIVSEAHIFEIYGKHGEYMKTCKNDFICREKEIDIYVGQCNLLTTHEISIKFPGASSEFWLCGIKLIVTKISTQLSTFDYNLIDEKLQASNIPITEKAEKFKKFVQEYTANKYAPKTMDPQMLLKFMEGECMSHLKPVSSTSKSISKYLASLIPSSIKNPNLSDQPNENIQSNIHSNPEEGTNFVTLKSYVDESLQTLENKLQLNFKKQLEELEAKQNEKLDRILELLQNSGLR